MNAVTKIEAAPPSDLSAEQAAWMHEGCVLVAERRDVDWRLADWLAAGKAANYLDQIKFDFLTENLGLTRKQLNDRLTAATSFPPALRVDSLTVEHHAAIAALREPGEMLPLLKQAAEERFSVNDCREVVLQRRYDNGDLFDDDDVAYTFYVRLKRLWNGAPPEAWGIFVEKLKSQGFTGIIDDDEVCDDEA